MESLNEFSENLAVRGYSEMEISDALGWLFDRLNLLTGKPSDMVEQNRDSVRVLHDFERMKIAPELFGYLLKLRSTGVISALKWRR